MSLSHLSSRRTSLALSRQAALIGSLMLLGACAHQSKGSDAYAPQSENSASDARNQYQDFRGREAVRAPSQLQITLPERGSQPRKNTDSNTPVQVPQDGNAPPDVLAASVTATDAPAASADDGSPWVRETQTYLGTVPCFASADAACRAQRVTLTLSPNGRWRSRTVTIDPPAATPDVQASQGCWRTAGDNRERVTLYNSERNQIIASFSFSHGNALVLRQLHEQGSSLTYRLARQPDLDPISELTGAAPECRGVV